MSAQGGKAAAAAVRKAATFAAGEGCHLAIGTVTAWSSPRATVRFKGSTVPSVMTSVQARSGISVGTKVIVMVDGALTMIIGTI